MRHPIYSLALLALFNQYTLAGGNVIPDVSPEVISDTLSTNNGFYLGLGASSLSLENDLSKEEFTAKGLTVLAGYQLNTYLAIEGRYTSHLGNLKYDNGTTDNPNYKDYPADFTNVGIYLKPMYALDDFTVYGLLGYGEVTLTDLPQVEQSGSVDRSEDGFQWGLGLAYNFTENMSVFVDYVNFYDDKGFDYRAQTADINANTWTLGVSYKF